MADSDRHRIEDALDRGLQTVRDAHLKRLRDTHEPHLEGHRLIADTLGVIGKGIVHALLLLSK